MPLTEASARQNLDRLLEDYARLSPDDRKTMSEASVVRQFIDRLLEEVLGWPIKDPARYKYELSTQAGRPDITLFPENNENIYLEAKRFGVIEDLNPVRYSLATKTLKPDQMGLPGIAADRTQEEQQAINYAFSNGATWAILTNFEKLRLFNARRDWLVLSFDDPYDYRHDFDLLWQLAYHNVLNGSLEILSNQRYARDIDTQYLDFINLWRTQLAQGVLQQRQANDWAFHPDGQVNLLLLRTVVQRFLDRLVIARFAEDHLVIRPGTLRQFYEIRKNNLYTFALHEFLRQFFAQFDREHNSALFAPNIADKVVFTDDFLLPLVDKLYEVRYRSMPADILGNTYEQYLGKTLVQRNGSVATADNLETRKKQGSYYTPQVIVRYIVDHSLGRYLYGTANGKPDGAPLPGEERKTSVDLRDLRVLDSACGSGSFLIYAYQVLAEFYEREIKRLQEVYDDQVKTLAARFDTITLDERIAAQRVEDEIKRISHYPRLILEQHLYGVDLDPQAAEIAAVNLIMRAMERRQADKRLPLILNQNVKVGNSLVGIRPDDARMSAHQAVLAALIGLRRVLTTDPDRMTEAEYNQRHLEKIQAELAGIDSIRVQVVMREYLASQRLLTMEETHPTYNELESKTAAVRAQLDADFAPHFSDIERVRPFHWGAEFPEAFYNDDGTLKDKPGFTIILGNPPWEILKPDVREFYAQYDARIESQLNRAQVEQRITELDVEDPQRRALYDEQTAATEQTAAYLRQSPDYTRQGRGDTATHKLFLERMYGLLHTTGRIGYVVPSGIYTDLGTKDLREMLLNEGRVKSLISLTNGASGGYAYFADIHRSFKITLLIAQKGIHSEEFQAVFRIDPREVPRPDDLPSFVANLDHFITIKVDSIKRFSPNSLSVMEFKARQDYEIAEKIYGDVPLLGDEVVGAWNVKFTAEFHMTNDRRLFKERGAVGAHGRAPLPLYEGKMIHQFDAFYAEPQYWLDETEASQRLASKYGVELGQLDYLRPRLAFRDIARSTDERSLIAAVIPPSAFAGNTAIVATRTQGKDMLFLLAILNSFCEDYIIRHKISTHVNMFYAYQLPMPRLTSGNPYFDAIVPRAARLTCTRAEFAGLWREVMGEEWQPSPPTPLPQGEGRSTVHPAVDPAERQRLRDEIDALVAQLYGLTRGEFDHILGTFPLVFPDTDEGQARRAGVLAVYDRVGQTLL